MTDLNTDTLWIQTGVGRYLDLFNPDPEHINLDDIVWNLSQICRFGGATRYPYSVAQHSCNVATLVAYQTKDPVLTLQALLHDATEAYMGDMITPLKQRFPLFKELEDNLWKSIARRFDLPEEMSPELRLIDRRIASTEKRYLIDDDFENKGWTEYSKLYSPHTDEEFVAMGITVAPEAFFAEVSAEVVRDGFFTIYENLTHAIKLQP